MFASASLYLQGPVKSTVNGIVSSLGTHGTGVFPANTNNYTSKTGSGNATTTAPGFFQNITAGISQAISGPQINDSWAHEFFNNVSKDRNEGYTYCASLSQFATKRFSTMAANYGISHYEYDQDFNEFWPGGYAYGDAIYTGFGEEVFYPSGYTPSGYVSDIQTSAPGHWQLLLNNTLDYYGYHIQNGPTYEILGPGGGYGAPCPVTEIPGPNINVSQYFAQYGCSVVTANDTWFVIELASVCP